MQKLLEDIVNCKNELIKEKISNEVYLINYKRTKILLKNIIIPFKKNHLISQKELMDYLIENKINIPRVYAMDYLIENKSKKIYQLQEYIKSNGDYDEDKLIIQLAKFHCATHNYKNFSTKKKYKLKFECKKVKLDSILLDFKLKYYKVPIKKYKKNKKKLGNNLLYLDKIVKYYKNIYKKFIKEYNLKSCIIHNDITSNNVIFNKNEAYLIDFDLSTYGTEYVDFTDAIIRRSDSLKFICENFNFLRENIIKNIKLYNSYNKFIELEYSGVIKMLIIKIVSVNIYLMMEDQNIEIFEKTLLYFKNIITILKGELEDD